MYRIICSYPSPHVYKGGLPELSDAIEFWSDAGISGQTDDDNYYWVEVECPLHGWQPLTFDSACQICDGQADHTHEQVEPLSDDDLEAIHEYEKMRMLEIQESDYTEHV